MTEIKNALDELLHRGPYCFLARSVFHLPINAARSREREAGKSFNHAPDVAVDIAADTVINQL